MLTPHQLQFRLETVMAEIKTELVHRPFFKKANPLQRHCLKIAAEEIAISIVEGEILKGNHEALSDRVATQPEAPVSRADAA